jgi:hypothetical protein
LEYSLADGITIALKKSVDMLEKCKICVCDTHEINQTLCYVMLLADGITIAFGFEIFVREILDANVEKGISKVTNSNFKRRFACHEDRDKAGMEEGEGG